MPAASQAVGVAAAVLADAGVAQRAEHEHEHDCAFFAAVRGQFSAHRSHGAEPAAQREGAHRAALSVDRYGVHFTAEGELRDLLEAARALASHRLPGGNMAELMKLALRAFIRETEKRRFAVGRKPRATRAVAGSPAAAPRLLSPVECCDRGATEQQAEAAPALPGSRRRKISRHIPAAVAREVYVRDEGTCSFISADGRRCNARVLLEMEHDQPFAVGGTATAGNLRLRCQAHNQSHARRFFGRAYVTAAIKRRRKMRTATDALGS